jgi:hypothetical protein
MSVRSSFLRNTSLTSPRLEAEGRLLLPPILSPLTVKDSRERLLNAHHRSAWTAGVGPGYSRKPVAKETRIGSLEEDLT